jgi:tetratricopeptide (TPR) repeat protein
MAFQLWTGVTANERGQVRELAEQEWAELSAKFHASRAPWLVALRAWQQDRQLPIDDPLAARLAYMNKAIEAQASAPLYLSRGDVHAVRADWPNALADFDRAIDLDINDVHAWYRRAVAYVAAGRLADYRSTCAEMRKRFADQPDRLFYAHVFHPDSGATAEQLTQWAPGASAAVGAGFTRTFGAAHYRSGEYQKAIEQFARSQEKWRPHAWDFFFRAMACFKQGDNERAQGEFAAGRDSLKNLSPDFLLEFGWWWKAEAEQLIKEAETLLSDQKSDPMF